MFDLRYLDKFMSGHDIKEPQLYLVCCGSVLLASKVCERESNIPRLSTLTALLPVKLSVSDLHSLEYWSRCGVASLLMIFVSLD